MRQSKFNKQQAIEAVKQFFRSKGLDWSGERWVSEYTVQCSTADCKRFPLPEGLDNWSGETLAYYVYDENMDEQLAVAFWEE